MAIVYSVINQKGGVAKTTTVYNISSKIADLGYKVLMIDLDPQANLTVMTGIEPEKLTKTITNVLINFNSNKKEPIENIIIKLTDNLHIAPSIIDLSAADNLLHNEMSREGVLKRALEPVKNYYDFIFIDCPPSLGQLPINALVASNYALVPVSTTYLAYRGLKMLINIVDQVKKNLNPDLKIYGIIATMNNRTIHSKEIREKLNDEYNLIGIVDTAVKTMDSIYEGKAIVETDKKNKVSIAYTKIAEKIIKDNMKGVVVNG